MNTEMRNWSGYDYMTHLKNEEIVKAIATCV